MKQEHTQEKEIDIRDFSPKELEILEFFAKSLAESPKQLKEFMLKESINQRARTLAFLMRVPKLYKAVDKLLEGG